MAKKEVKKMPVEEPVKEDVVLATEEDFQASEEQVVATQELAAQVEPMPAKAPEEQSFHFEKVELKNQAHRITAGMIAGLDATDRNWVVEVNINDKKCYIVSTEAYNNRK